MTHAAHDEATRRLGIDWPIVQGPFGGGLSTVQLAATVSNLGGLGSFGAHMLAPDALEPLTRELRSITGAPFAINLWVSDHDAGGAPGDEAAFEHAWRLFEPVFQELGVPRPALPTRYHPSFAEQIDALIEARPPVFSFVFGIPPATVLAECRRRSITTIGAATSIAEALALDAAGVDLIVATGAEAGGHRPAFLARAEDSLMGTFALVQLVSARVKAPVIAAGGIADARGIRAALALGAQAVQIGTAFLACEESGAVALHRNALFTSDAERTTLTRGYTGRLARGLRSPWTERMAAGAGVSPFPIQGWFLSHLRSAAIEQDRSDLIALWSGQIAPNLRHRRAADLMQSLLTAFDTSSHHLKEAHA